jgi:predicted ATP-binding protein involved in virulence
MKIKNLKISGIGGIKELELTFHDGFNVICGPNGVGKTTVLDIIADAFTFSNSKLKRNASYEKGKYTIEFQNVNGESRTKKLEVLEFIPEKQDSGRSSSIESQYVLLFSINRMMNYNMLEAIPKDKSRKDYESANQLHSGVGISDLKGWFINRYVFQGRDKSLVETQEHNFELAKRAISLLDSTVQFSTVEASTLDIMLETDRGTIYFEYLSAGYKTCFYLILGLIKEIEFRFKTPTMKAEDFNGVVLIDEIDLHLHPTWQGKIIKTLKQLFPKIQFIVTTHSPSVLQTLNQREIIALNVDEEGNITRKTFELGQYGLQGWTIEEILKDIMGMETTNSLVYEVAIRKFDEAMDREDAKAVKEAYVVLKEMLHPNNILLKMMDIQTAGLEEEE